MSESPGTVQVLAGELRFLVDGRAGFPLVEVEDSWGVVHRGRFAGRIPGTGTVWLHLFAAGVGTWWIECAPGQVVTVLE